MSVPGRYTEKMHHANDEEDSRSSIFNTYSSKKIGHFPTASLMLTRTKNVLKLLSSNLKVKHYAPFGGKKSTARPWGFALHPIGDRDGPQTPAIVKAFHRHISLYNQRSLKQSVMAGTHSKKSSKTNGKNFLLPTKQLSHGLSPTTSGRS